MIKATVIIKIAKVPTEYDNGTTRPALFFSVGDLVICEIHINEDQFQKLQAIGIPEIKKQQ